MTESSALIFISTNNVAFPRGGMMKFSNKTTVAAILWVLGVTSAYADEMAPSSKNFYVLGAVGQSKWDLGDAGGVPTVNDTDTAWKLQLGYKFNRYLAIEGGYIDMGGFDMSGNRPSDGKPVRGTGSGYAVNVAAVGSLPLGDEFSLFGKLGLAWVSGSGAVTVGGVTTDSFSGSETKANYGAGLNWDFSRELALRAEYERIQDNADIWSVGIAFKF
jgi:OOP family OmpA-OmpF porin